jgi:hypothetical protein
MRTGCRKLTGLAVVCRCCAVAVEDTTANTPPKTVRK